MADVSEGTLKLKMVISILAVAIGLTATTATTILSIKADSKTRFEQLKYEMAEQKSYYATELRVVNLRLDDLERRFNAK